MGCCYSCFGRGNDTSKTSERSHLLAAGGDGSSYSESLNARMSYSRYDAAREQESLQKIVQKTSENLIDISNSHVNERLLQQQQQLSQHQQLDTTERANEYKALINTIKLNSKTFPKIQEKSSTISKLKKRQTLSHLIHQQQQQLQDHKENSPKEQVNDESTKSRQNSESSSSSGLILSEGKITNEDEELLSKAMDEINQALKQIKVEYVGDLVVPLTWANSAPINSNSTQG